MLRKIFNRPAQSFDQVDQMVTRQLPIPDLEGTGKTIQFTAKRGKLGHWTISSKHNMRHVTAGLQKVSLAYQQACEKHAGRKPMGEAFEMNFDTAFLILKDMEESLLKYRATAPAEEPKHHFMSAYRLLPEKFREGLDEIYFARSDRKGLILPPKAGKPALEAKTQPAARLDAVQNPKPPAGPAN